MEMKFEVGVDPKPMPRPRFARFGRVFFTKDIRDYQAVVRQAAIETGCGKLEGEVSARLRFYGRFKASSRRAGDCDNLAKAVLDALNGVCYEDDSAVTSLQVEKIQDKENPRIEVELCQRADVS